jgi:D-apionate oxidoisomerase
MTTPTTHATQTVALYGAAGSMGTRITAALNGHPAYQVLFVEATGNGEERLRARGNTPTPTDQAAKQAGIAVLAVPDTLVGDVAERIVPLLQAGAMVMCLDPAAPYAGKLPQREDVSYFVTHPSHPLLFNDDPDPEARRDYFGAGKARQSIVNALVQGSEADYARGEALAAAMFGPILRSHRVTLEQMAILEPVLSETIAGTCLMIIREAMDEAVRRGIPEEAARDFLLGHLNVELAIYFNVLDWQLSAGAEQAIEDAKKQIIHPDWKKVFEPESLRDSIAGILGDKHAS